jgi:hypothetical protein
MEASLQGTFVAYSATYEHINPLGDPDLSLIDSLNIWPTTHVVISKKYSICLNSSNLGSHRMAK